jgi:hypothetical protein
MEETHLRKRRQTVKLGLIKTVGELFPEYRLKTAYSIQEGVFCNLSGSVLSEREVGLISRRLAEWVEADRASGTRRACRGSPLLGDRHTDPVESSGIAWFWACFGSPNPRSSAFGLSGPGAIIGKGHRGDQG